MKPKITIQTKQLKKALSFIDGCMLDSPLNPICENALFSVNKNELLIQGSDSYSTRLGIKIPVLSGKFSGDFLLPFQDLKDLVNRIADESIDVVVDQQNFNHNVLIDEGRYKLPSDNANDFPNDDIKTKGNHLALLAFIEQDRQLLIDSLRSTIFSVGKDDLRIAMTGICLTIESNTLSFVSTDGHLLASYTLSKRGSDTPQQVVIPGKLVRSFINLLDEHSKGAATLTIKRNVIRLTVDGHFAEGSLIIENFPDCKTVIEAALVSCKNIVSVDRVLLIQAINRIILIANKTTFQIALAFTETWVNISAQDLGYNTEGIERVSVDPVSIVNDIDNRGVFFETAFNGKKLLSTLQNIGSEMVTFRLATGNRAVLLFGSIDNFFCLVMPQILNEKAKLYEPESTE